jgi:hypothetical protein
MNQVNEKLKVQIYADGADKNGILDLYALPYIKGLTTNPTLMKKAGITDYDIRVGITGKEKVDFIKSCKVSFNTSLLESYSFAFLECVGHMPVVVLDSQSWSDNFDIKFYHKTNVRKAHEVIRSLYDSSYNDDALMYVNDLDIRAKTAWSNI